MLSQKVQHWFPDSVVTLQHRYLIILRLKLFRCLCLSLIQDCNKSSLYCGAVEILTGKQLFWAKKISSCWKWYISCWYEPWYRPVIVHSWVIYVDHPFAKWLNNCFHRPLEIAWERGSVDYLQRIWCNAIKIISEKASRLQQEEAFTCHIISSKVLELIKLCRIEWTGFKGMQGQYRPYGRYRGTDN